MYRLLLLNFVDSFIDNCILSCVDEPAYGGIVQCELLLALPHTAVSMWVTAILFILMEMEPLSKVRPKGFLTGSMAGTPLSRCIPTVWI